MQLVGFGRYPRRVRICSGSGAGIVASLAGGSDRVAVLSCQVEPGDLVTVLMSTEGHSPAEINGAAAPYWGLKGILYVCPEPVVNGAPATATDSRSDLGMQAATPPTRLEARKWDPSPTQRVPLRIAPAMDDSRRAISFDEFLQSADTSWACGCATVRQPPILVDDGDKVLFYNAYGPDIGLVHDQVSLVRRSDQYVSMSRFSEDSIFDCSGVSRALGYLEGSPPVTWLSKEADGTWISEKALRAAPPYDKSYLVFFNGNLHNYYHWVVEAILSLDVLVQAIGPDQNVKIALPKSMDINAVFDHRASLPTVGLDRYKIIEAGADVTKLGLVHGVQFCDTAEGQGFRASISVDLDKLDALYRIVDAH